MRLELVWSDTFIGGKEYSGYIDGSMVFPYSEFHDEEAAKRELVEYAVAKGHNCTVKDVVVRWSGCMA